MVAHAVDADADDLAVACCEFIGQRGNGAQLGGADRGEVLRMRKEQRPAVADPIVEADLARGGVGSEIGSGVIETQCHGHTPCDAASAVLCKSAQPVPRRIAALDDKSDRISQELTGASVL